MRKRMLALSAFVAGVAFVWGLPHILIDPIALTDEEKVAITAPFAVVVFVVLAVLNCYFRRQLEDTTTRRRLQATIADALGPVALLWSSFVRQHEGAREAVRMTRFKRLAVVGVCAAVMAGVVFAVNPMGKHRLDPDPTRESSWYALSAFTPRNHRDGGPRPKPASPMPPTSCGSVEPVPKYDDNRLSGPDHVHGATVRFFENESGFGFFRMFYFENDRGVTVSSRAIDRVELVSLLTESEPSVYVLDEMATPALARQAQRRPLDEFERLGLDAVRRGEELVWTREAPTRMFGAIRAEESCLKCHKSAKAGDLLGAFTYYLKTPVDRLTD